MTISNTCRESGGGRVPGHSGEMGFSIVEILVVILVIAIMTAIALPMIVGVTDGSADYVKDKRNAQMLSSISSAAQVAGLDFVIPGDLTATIDNVVSGATVAEGQFTGERFAVPGLSADDKAGASLFLSVQNGMLVFHSDD